MRDLYIRQLIERAVREDVGPGDATTEAIVPPLMEGTAVLSAQGTGILSGLSVQDPLMSTLVELIGESCAVNVEDVKKDGNPVFAGEEIIGFEGSLRVILAAERTFLNFLQHLSGIATETSRYVAAVRGTDVKIMDTRKTTPGMRILEKDAVVHGGGFNHRTGLYDGVMIKDNHIRSAGGIVAAIKAAKEKAPRTLRIEVECATLEDVKESLGAGADMIQLDNMTLDVMREAVSIAKGKAILEATGGITLQTVREVAETGVDMISVGAITHSAPILPMHMDVQGVAES